MHVEFSPLSLQDFERYTRLWNVCPVQAMDYTFVNLWGWQEYNHLQWHFSKQLCWLMPKQDTAQEVDDAPLRTLWAPVGDWQAVNWQEEACLHGGAKLLRVPELLAQVLENALPGRVHIEENRDQFEYLYDREGLATLSGNRYQKKRNHVNGFRKTYGEPDYRVMDESILEDVFSLQDAWCKWHECSNSPSLEAENTAINRVLSHWRDFPFLVGGALYVQDTMVAFSVGEVLADQTLGVHFEKGHSGYRGVYQTMNTLFVQNAGACCLRVNREQDLGEEGLRQAKMTYLPVDFLRKYTVTISPR